MKKYFILTLIAIFSIPLAAVIKIPATDVWYSQYLMLFIISCIAASLVLWQFNKTISLLSLYCLFSTIAVAQQSPRAMLCLIHLYLGLFAIYMISKFDRRQRKIILNAMIALFVIQSAWIILQKLGLDMIFNDVDFPRRDATVALSGSYNQVGLYFAVMCPLIIANAPYLGILNGLGLYLSQTTTAVLATVLGIAVYFFITNKRIFLIFLIIGAILSALYWTKVDQPSMEKFADRVNIAKYSILSVNRGYVELADKPVINSETNEAYLKWWHDKHKERQKIQCNPLFGFGLGNFMRIAPLWQAKFLKMEKIYSHAHNDFIEAYFELGQVGFLFVLFIVADFFYKFFKVHKTKILTISFCAIVTHMLCALGIFTIHTAVSAMMLILFLGIFYGEVRDGCIA